MQRTKKKKECWSAGTDMVFSGQGLCVTTSPGTWQNLAELGETGECSTQSYFDGIRCHQAPEITIMFCVFRLTIFRAATLQPFGNNEHAGCAVSSRYLFCFPSIKICPINVVFLLIHVHCLSRRNYPFFL